MKNETVNDEFTRKRKARQRKIRKRRIKIFIGFLVVALLITGTALSLTVLFPIDSITVTGANSRVQSRNGSEKYTAEEILSAASIKKGDNLFTAKADAGAMAKKLPYVQSVQTVRKLPGSLTLKVKDAAEYACYKADGKYFTVSRSLHVLNRCDEPPENMLLILAGNVSCKVGEDVQYGDNKAGGLIEQIEKSAEEYSLTLNRIDITDELAISVKTEGRFVVNFGTSNGLDGKFAHLASMIKNIDTQKTGTVNLSMWSSSNTEGTFVEGTAE